MSGSAFDRAAAETAFDRAMASPEQVFDNFFLTRLLGLRIDYGLDSCTVSFELNDFMFNPQGSLHGGVVALAMDVSMGHLLRHLQGAGTTLELKVQYLLALRSGRVRAEGRVLRRGMGIAFLESRLYDSDGALAAFASSTWKLLRPS